MAEFKERVKFLRIKNHLSQQNLANKIKLDKQTISQYELGKRKPSHEILLQLCDTLNVSSDYLLGYSNTMNQSLNTEELEIIGAYNELTPDQKTLVRTMLGLSPLEASDKLA